MEHLRSGVSVLDCKYYFDLQSYVTDVASGSTVAFFVWLFGHRWFSKELSKIKWQQSGNVWWLACDLHSIKAFANLSKPEKMLHAVDQAIHHARSIGMDDFLISRLANLRKTAESSPLKNDEIEKQIDEILDYCGKMAEKNQPDYKPQPGS